MAGRSWTAPCSCAGTDATAVKGGTWGLQSAELAKVAAPEGNKGCSPLLPQRHSSEAQALPFQSTNPPPPRGAGCAQQVLLSHHCFTAGSTQPHHRHQALPSALASTQPPVVFTQSNHHPPALFPIQVIGPSLPTPREKIALVQPSLRAGLSTPVVAGSPRWHLWSG